MNETLRVTVDKSHLITIGERLYTEAIELVRELVNNAYDADATQVQITMRDDQIHIRDNGLGMDLPGLTEYFTIGTADKRLHPKSPRFGRERIGHFGIGKFAALAAADRFIVETQRDGFHARVVFDKEQWERGTWELPMELLPPDPERGEGTTVILSRLRKRFRTEDVERRILDSVPLRAQRFAVFVNGKRIRPRRLPGERLPFREETPFGPVHGEVVILPQYLASAVDMGLEVRVKGALIRRELLGMERWGQEATWVRGEVNADFLPVTTDRSGFVTDSQEYRDFRSVMAGVLADVHRKITRLANRKERQRASRALRDAFHRIQEALMRNPELSPFEITPSPPGHEAPAGDRARAQKEKRDGAERPAEGSPGSPRGASPEGHAAARPGEARKKRRVRRRLTPLAVVQELRLGPTGFACCLDHFGRDGPEAFHEGSTVYINSDHPLYRRHKHKSATHTFHIARLIAQEIALMKEIHDPKAAFRHQSVILRDAFGE